MDEEKTFGAYIRRKRLEAAGTQKGLGGGAVLAVIRGG